MSALSPLLAGVALVLSSLVLASPAQAALVIDLQAASTTVTAGDPVELSWTSTDAVTVTATGDWPDVGSKAPNGSESVPTTGPGSLTFTLTADDGDPETSDATSTVTVTVTNDDDPALEVTPTAPPTDGCFFTIPDLEGVIYSVDIDMELIELEPDDYPSFVFADDEGVVTIVATAGPGFVLADGAADTFQIEVSDDCLGDEVADVVDVSAGCEKVTFTNISDSILTIEYGDEDDDEPAGEFTLAVDESRTVKSLSSSTVYFAYPSSLGDLEDFDDIDDLNELIELLSSIEFGEIRVPQNCVSGAGASHPTVAPAAGV